MIVWIVTWIVTTIVPRICDSYPHPEDAYNVPRRNANFNVFTATPDACISAIDTQYTKVFVDSTTAYNFAQGARKYSEISGVSVTQSDIASITRP